MSEMGAYKYFDELKKKEEGYDAIVRKFGSIENALEAVAEEDVLKFYYCESEDKYLVGKRVSNMYYAEIGKTNLCFTMSRNLPWGKHVVAPHTLWKEHTYPSEPKEIPFFEWLQGYIRQINSKTNAVPVVHGEWIGTKYYTWECSVCGFHPFKGYIPATPGFNFCPNCGAKMDGKKVE